MKRILPIAICSLLLIFAASCGREGTGDEKIDALIAELPSGWNGELRNDSLIFEWREEAWIAWENMTVPDSMRYAGLTFTPEYIRENGEKIRPSYVIRVVKLGSVPGDTLPHDELIDIEGGPWFRTEKYNMYHGHWNWERPVGREYRAHFEPDSLWHVFRNLNVLIGQHLDPIL